MVLPFFFRRGFTYGRLIEITRAHEKSIPPDRIKDFIPLREEIKGISDAIPWISYDDIMLQNAYIELVYGTLIPISREFPARYEMGCTAFAAMNTTIEPKIIMGQNFDLSQLFQPTASFVHHKVENYPEVFSLRFGAMLSLPAGFNEHGVTLNVNIVKSKIKSEPIIPTGVRTRMGYYLSKSAEEVYNLLQETNDSICYNLTVGDYNHAFTLEINPYSMPRTELKSWLVRSNTFLSRDLQKYLLRKKYSKKRQTHGEELIKERYEKSGNITEMDLLKILSDKPTISRSKTIAFVTQKHFGVGKPHKGKFGKVPNILKKKNE